MHAVERTGERAPESLHPHRWHVPEGGSAASQVPPPDAAPSTPSTFPLGVSSVAEARKLAKTLLARAEAWDNITRKPGKHGGVLGGPSVLAVFRALIEHWNPETGRLYPSQKTIAKAKGAKGAKRSERTVRFALAKLQEFRLITRKPRYFYPHKRNDRLAPSRNTDEYTLLPHTHWKGYVSRNHAAAPDPPPGDLWGAPSPVPSPIDQAIPETDLRTKIATLEQTPPIGESSALPKALAGLGRAFVGESSLNPGAAREFGPLKRALNEAVEASAAGYIRREDAPEVALAAAPATAAPADDTELELRGELERQAAEAVLKRQEAQASLAASAASRAAARQKPAHPPPI